MWGAEPGEPQHQCPDPCLPSKQTREAQGEERNKKGAGAGLARLCSPEGKEGPDFLLPIP